MDKYCIKGKEYKENISSQEIHSNAIRLGGVVGFFCKKVDSIFEINPFIEATDKELYLIEEELHNGYYNGIVLYSVYEVLIKYIEEKIRSKKF